MMIDIPVILKIISATIANKNRIYRYSFPLNFKLFILKENIGNSETINRENTITPTIIV